MGVAAIQNFLYLKRQNGLSEKAWQVAVFVLQRIEEALSTPKSRKQLLEMTKLPDRTLRYNLAILKSRGAVKESVTLKDMRSKLYCTARIPEKEIS